LFNEVNEKKKVLKEQEELVEKEKGRLMKAREEVRKEELEIRKEQKRLQSQFEGLMIVKSRASVQERILKGYHRNSKSEGKPGLRSPINREACSALLPNQVSSLTLSYNNSNK
jgi:predicted  nucleic acid-binding Zn-ribbon protein